MSTPTDSASKRPMFGKYLFMGRAYALAGSIRKPYYQDLGNHLEIATHAGSGGQITCSSRDFKLENDISYESATTSIVAGEVDKGIYECTVMSQVINLRVGDVLRVAEVTCRLKSRYDSRDYPEIVVPRISPAGSRIEGLEFNGKLRDVERVAAFEVSPDEELAFLRGEFDDDPAYRPDPRRIPKPFYEPGFGTVYYGEWVWLHPNEQRRQHINMLRLALGSDQGVDLDAGSAESDGSGWPPLGG
jgi:hypothetical protein